MIHSITALSVLVAVVIVDLTIQPYISLLLFASMFPLLPSFFASLRIMLFLFFTTKWLFPFYILFLFVHTLLICACLTCSIRQSNQKINTNNTTIIISFLQFHTSHISMVYYCCFWSNCCNYYCKIVFLIVFVHYALEYVFFLITLILRIPFLTVACYYHFLQMLLHQKDI